MEKTAVKLFYICLFLFVSAVIYLSVVMFISPRRDILERGFIPCTKELVANLSLCKSGEIVCPLKYFWLDLNCNIKVVGEGISAWVRQEQSTPWSNYLFEPVYDIPLLDETGIDAVKWQADWKNIKLQEDIMTRKREELENAKIKALQLNQGVEIANPETKLQGDENLTPYKEDMQEEMENGDISTEAFTEEITKISQDEKISAEQSQQRDTLTDIRKKTQNKLNSKELKDER